MKKNVTEKWFKKKWNGKSSRFVSKSSLHIIKKEKKKEICLIQLKLIKSFIIKKKLKCKHDWLWERIKIKH